MPHESDVNIQKFCTSYALDLMGQPAKVVHLYLENGC